MNDEFVKINFNTIANLSGIETIERIYSENLSYKSYVEQYNSLLTEVVKKYMVEHIDELDIDADEESIANDLYDKFAPYVRKNVIEDLGYSPDPYICEYKICMKSGKEYMVDEDTINKICELIDVKFDNIEKSPEIYD